MNIKGLTANSTDVNRPNEYLYNGKMMQDEMGLGWLDYGARFYDPTLGRWHCIDPIIKPFESLYASFSNNPLLFIDPMGTDTSFATDDDRKYVLDIKISDGIISNNTIYIDDSDKILELLK